MIQACCECDAEARSACRATIHSPVLHALAASLLHFLLPLALTARGSTTVPGWASQALHALPGAGECGVCFVRPVRRNNQLLHWERQHILPRAGEETEGIT
jgi:hypothetical protein